MNKIRQSAAIKEMLANQKIPVLLTWPAIFIAFFVFWPVCLGLISKRTRVVNKTALSNGGGLRVLGWLSIIASFAVVLSTSPGTRYLSAGQTYLFINFFAGGIGLISLGAAVKNFTYRLRKYLSLILDNGMTSIDDIAARINRPYRDVAVDLQRMIDMGLFGGAYIDGILREIVFTEEPERHDYETADGREGKEAVVTCKGCGAVNRIAEGSVGECEFCGSPIS
jgi:hypothetical protein